MEEVLRISPLPSKVLQSFINTESDEIEQQEVFSSCPNGKPNINALVTLPRGLHSSSLSALQDTIIEESSSPSKKLPSSMCTLSRKAPIRRTSVASSDHFAKQPERKNHVLTKSHSATLEGMPTAYDPNEPLTKLPIKQQISTNNFQSREDYFTRTKSINVTIGPLTKEVCGKLNISWENSDPCVSPQDNKIDATYMKLIVPDHTDGEIFSIQFKENFNLNTIKEELVSLLKKKYPGGSWNFIFTYLFIYKIEGYHYQLLDDFQYILNSFLYQYYLLRKEFPLIEVKEKPLLTEEEAELHDTIHKITELEINSLISHESGSFNDTQSFNFSGDDEVAWTRSRLQSFAVEVARYRNPTRYSMIMELDHSPITEYFAIRVPPNNMITIFIHLQDIFTLKRQFNLNATAEFVLSQVYPSLKAIDLVHTQMHLFTLQVTGEESYLNGDIKLIQFKAVRRAIFKREDLHLSVVNKPNVINDRLYGLVWPLVDPFTGSAPSHSYLINLANCGPMNSMVNALSLWDMTFPFKICIKKISNVPQQQYKRDIGVEVEVGLYISGKLLKGIKTTQSTALKETTVWNECITFEFDMHNIPKAARLMIIVKEDKNGRRKSSLGTNMTPELYWITTSLVDYRSLLKVGTHELHLWPTIRTSGKEFEKLSEGEKFFYNPSSIGPTANNPDPNAVKLKLEFESFAHPIVFPNDIPPADLLDYAEPRMPSGQRNSRIHQAGINKLIKVINQDKQFTMVLQTYIQKLDWSKPEQVAEAYRFLNELKEPLPLAVAFKFLDSTCPDEFIRAFAVERLRELEDDELMGFLLQLVQALKFEANHDSALARFLLERALQNKLIGHLFFWYSRCEAQNPRFTARYGTLLEAYLVGCGKAMLESFVNQVSILTYFKDISKQLDEDGSKNAADSQKLLKELMTKYKFSARVVIPTHDPRLRLGNLEPERCKIMQSKKMPMWLWMSNIHPSALQPIPYKLIVKSGDDLRQDMLTLQMLTLFDKIWQEDGLDLCLIPYGCVATGPNSGVIEVVKNARTVADISGIKDSSKLYQWIKDHQRDQFGEEDPDLFQVAINKFVRSCAGYSVATYVLGIGDRHNDNIMVTTSGNLFHIDFGHFLGNVKHFMKIKREWCPFVLTPDFINVMGGEKSSTFVKFKNLCCRAFLSLRKNADLIINLFSIMRYTGIPELTCVEDLEYLSNALMVTKSDANAEECFIKLINKCIRLGWTVQISWWAHVTKNKKS